MVFVTPTYGLHHPISYTQSGHHVYIKCPHQLWCQGSFPWGKVGWSWS